ncbi:unnamed protein product [Gongylonema pulchrum]|uniref:Beta-lactamase domain-containing protein n=1 Tax=Gongylonema pulchrum TaxID=637853 RepID=A0A183ECL4_9BILA|nr:unnamed protein product [Gongylonema pulchrum]
MSQDIGCCYAFGIIALLQLLTGNVISSPTQQLLNKVSVNMTDVCLNERVAKGNGLVFFDINRAQVTHAYGHSGYGCQQVIHDAKSNLTIAYVTNAMKFGIYDQCRTYIRLQQAVYDVVEKIQKA